MLCPVLGDMEHPMSCRVDTVHYDPYRFASYYEKIVIRKHLILSLNRQA